MADLFLKILNMSIAASYLVLAVVLLRLLLKKAPRWTIVLLWGIVALRLICPVSIESVMSLIPSAEPIPDSVLSSPGYDVQPGIPSADNIVVGGTQVPSQGTQVGPQPVRRGPTVMSVLSAVWLAGMLMMTVYTAVSYWRLHRKVATAVRFRERIYTSEHVQTPFILGLFRPRIYLPYGLSEGEMAHIFAHEQAHICRKDHWWKPLGFLLLTVHWFNPLMWLAYVLLSRDIERACDEKVIRTLEADQRADYSQTLLKCSISRRSIAACPLAFGEVGVKERVKNVLSYKKPAFWVIVAAVAVCIVVAVCFLTNPITGDDPEQTQPSSTQPEEDPSVQSEPKVIRLFDMDDADSPMQGEMTLEAFPGVTFRWDFTSNDSNECLVAVKDGETTVPFPFGGVYAVYAADVTGDGKPDLCANIRYYFSGLFLPDAVSVYDCANDLRYTLSRNMNDSFAKQVCYRLRVEDGNLLCDRMDAHGENVLVTGTLAFGDCETGKQLYLKCLVSYDYTIYKFVGEDVARDRVQLTLCSDGTCTLDFGTGGTSGQATGTYDERDGKLYIFTDDDRTYMFRYEGEDLVFVESGSSDLPENCGLYDGGILKARTVFQ